MRFTVIESTYLNQGSAKAFAVHDAHNRTYYIPRSQVSIIDKQEPQTEYDVAHLLIEVKDWVIRKNNIPVFNITEMHLDR